MRQKEKNGQTEQDRLAEMRKMEEKLYHQGFQYIAGLDEAGRGPWAGPVSAAAVILPQNFYLEGVDDSKNLTAKKREYLAGKIRNMALDWTVVLVSPQVIDSLNILEATKLAMTQAVRMLTVPPDYLLLDAVSLPQLKELPQNPLIKGDQKSITIACASILAKVTRDQVMEQYEKLYPGYGFLKHKGYGTKLHIERLNELGVSPIHRLSYRPVQKVVQKFRGEEENIDPS